MTGIGFSTKGIRASRPDHKEGFKSHNILINDIRKGRKKPRHESLISFKPFFINGISGGLRENKICDCLWTEKCAVHIMDKVVAVQERKELHSPAQVISTSKFKGRGVARLREKGNSSGNRGGNICRKKNTLVQLLY